MTLSYLSPKGFFQPVVSVILAPIAIGLASYAPAIAQQQWSNEKAQETNAAHPSPNPPFIGNLA